MPRRITIEVIVLLAAIGALGLYVFHLKRSAALPQPHLADTRPIGPPVAGPAVWVPLVVANDSDGSLSGVVRKVVMPRDPTKRGKEVLRALLAEYLERGSTHPLGAGSDINEVYVLSDGLAVVDVNAAFVDGHRSGILTEELTLASLAQTLAANVPGITRVKFLVDGKERLTLAGHADLSEPYPVAEATRLMKTESQITGPVSH